MLSAFTVRDNRVECDQLKGGAGGGKRLGQQRRLPCRRSRGRGSPLCFDLKQFQLSRAGDRLRAAAHMEFAVDIVDMRLDGAGGDDQVRGDFGIG